MPATLTWRMHGDDADALIPLVSEYTVVGRAPREAGIMRPGRDYWQAQIGNTLYIGTGFLTMNRTHFGIRHRASDTGQQGWWIQDLKSSGGIAVNDVRNEGDAELELHDGDIIRAGGTRFQFRVFRRICC